MPTDTAAPRPRDHGVRRFGRVNWLGLRTLIERETRRFLAVWTQTLLAPLATAGLFLLIFTIAVGSRRGEVMGVSFVHFLAPGILMMTVIQNSFANTSSSITAAKVQGNIVDTLMPPLSAGELLAGYLSGSVVRAGLVATVIGTGMMLVTQRGISHPLWALCFVLLAAVLLGGLGILAGIMAQKFDQMAAITNFIITPLSFLSGTFYSVQTLPQPFNTLSHWNPIFYLIDGARYGVTGVSDAPPLRGALICTAVAAVVLYIAWRWLKTGYRMKP